MKEFRLSENLKWITEQNKITQEALAERLGKSAYSIGEFERGQLNPGLDTFTELCLTLDMPADALLFERNLEPSQDIDALMQKLSGMGREQLLDILHCFQTLARRETYQY